MNNYIKRLIETTIKDKLQTCGAVLLEGPKFCGKTTTCKLLSKSFVQLISNDEIEIYSVEPSLTLVGETPHLIDEWQNIPIIWDLVRKEVDERNEFGLFILTGSATPAEGSKIHHSGAGRIVKLKMRPMSLLESSDSTGKVSLSSLLENPNQIIFDEPKNSTLNDIAYLICRGGWPKSIIASEENSIKVSKNYYDGLFNFKESGNSIYKNKDPLIAKGILKSYARNISTQASYKTIHDDVKDVISRNIDIKTLDSYLKILEDLNIIDDLSSWSNKFRSKSTIRSKPTRRFVDPSIAAISLGLNQSDLLKDPNTFGLLFEDLVIRDLRVYLDYLNGNVYHYRDSNGLEADAILHFENGSWAAIEVKLGSPKGIEEGASSLLKIKELAIKDNNQPRFLMIITATGKAYRRKDGIYICPITSLGV